MSAHALLCDDLASERKIAAYRLYLQSLIWRWGHFSPCVHKCIGMTFALAYRKNQNDPSCPLATLPKEILIHILRLFHRAQESAQAPRFVPLSRDQFAAFIRDPDNRQLYNDYRESKRMYETFLCGKRKHWHC